MQQKSLKVLAWILCLLGLSAAMILGFFLFTSEDTREAILSPKEIESVWYSNYPTENTITFYTDGTYSSQHWGSPEGSYSIVRNNRELTDAYHSKRTAIMGEHTMEFTERGASILYYDSKELFPETTVDPEEYELLCKRKTAVTKIMDQAEWKNKEGHQLGGTMTELTLDGKTEPYTVEELNMAATQYDAQIKFGEEMQNILIDVDIDTMLYTLTWGDMVFTADGTDFDLDC